MGAGRVEIVVEGPNKVQVLLLYGGASILPVPHIKFLHAGPPIRVVCACARLGTPMSHGGKSFPSFEFRGRDCYNPMMFGAPSLPTTHVFSGN